MAYTFTDDDLGLPPITDTAAGVTVPWSSSVQPKIPLGTIRRAVDPTYGEGEFIYLLGIANTAVGSLVTYHPSTYLTALAPVGTNKPQPIAVAMSANVASQYGWYQIGGLAVMKKSCTICCVAGTTVGVLTVGLIANSASGKEVQGALVAATASAAAGRTSVTVSINRPHMQGRVT